ncbi:50S ribosomal protein P1 [Halobacteriales archaeon QH_10_65_19]|nr:MAG: 50S ribosomal protein P1 [Halobacteriales archaeon QH_10_65_19]
MEYVYAALILNESGAEINEKNLTNVLDGADIDEAVADAAAVPAATGGGGSAAPATDEPAEEEDEEAEAAEEEEDDEDDDEGDAGEGLGELFG